MGGGEFFKCLAGGFGLGLLGGGEDNTRSVVAELGERDALLRTDAAEEFVRHLCENACAVAGVVLGADGATVVEVEKNGQRIAYDLVGFSAMDIDDEADAAGVMLEGGIVEALLRRRAGEAGFLVFHGILCFPYAYSAPVTTLEKPGGASREKYSSTAKSHNEFLSDFFALPFPLPEAPMEVRNSEFESI